MAVLDEVEYRRNEGGEDLEAIYRLRYKSFRRHGLLLSESADERMVDELDEAPNCYKFGVFMNNHLVSTIRLHHLTKEMPYAPSMTVFSDILQPRLERGESFIDPSRLSIDPDLTTSFRVLPYITLRLAFIGVIHFNTSGCISMIREEHTAFYARSFDSISLCEPRLYPPFTMPIFLYETRTDVSMQLSLERFPFFASTASERRMLFDQPKRGELAPLTILPTAKYLKAAA
ncbi:N-acyl amino acid synthase FeeM domain-containing protein [Chelativorans xinjiangense]|uniref:N-acyl amino acid synthase FeeM domain-containing protein n=1 Tax=Chelativorans xinjiangense TaxID=2681485 RepID=UPI001FECF6AC|nr:hypothetical protein [Chelativorans xinjiangense]